MALGLASSTRSYGAHELAESARTIGSSTKRDRLQTGPSERAALDYRLCFSRVSNASATVSINLP